MDPEIPRDDVIQPLPVPPVSPLFAEIAAFEAMFHRMMGFDEGVKPTTRSSAVQPK